MTQLIYGDRIGKTAILEEIAQLDLMEHHRIRIEDAFTRQVEAFVR